MSFYIWLTKLHHRETLRLEILSRVEINIFLRNKSTLWAVRGRTSLKCSKMRHWSGLDDEIHINGVTFRPQLLWLSFLCLTNIAHKWRLSSVASSLPFFCMQNQRVFLIKLWNEWQINHSPTSDESNSTECRAKKALKTRLKCITNLMNLDELILMWKKS